MNYSHRSFWSLRRNRNCGSVFRLSIGIFFGMKYRKRSHCCLLALKFRMKDKKGHRWVFFMGLFSHVAQTCKRCSIMEMLSFFRFARFPFVPFWLFFGTAILSNGHVKRAWDLAGAFQIRNDIDKKSKKQGNKSSAQYQNIPIVITRSIKIYFHKLWLTNVLIEDQIFFQFSFFNKLNHEAPLPVYHAARQARYASFNPLATFMLCWIPFSNAQSRQYPDLSWKRQGL